MPFNVWITHLLSFTISELMETKQFVNNLKTASYYLKFGIRYRVFLINFNVSVDASATEVNKNVLILTTITLALDKNIVNPASGKKLFLFTCNEKDACER